MSDILDKAQGYLSRCLLALYPNIEILPDLLGVCTQIDNVLAGQQAENARLRAEVERLKAGGCARDQSTTQFCAEAVALLAENARLRAALRDIARQPEGDEESAQAVARAVLGEKQ